MGLSKDRAVTILEFQTFRKDADTLFSVEELDHLRVTLACAPRIGDLIPGTGGVRKLRWGLARRGQGKRGGARVIYYFHNEAMPLALIAVYAKGRRRP
ncbi:addiction module toxin RelE [Roseospira goensis]|uniref:Addiction module toxin RelE n=1 Tax=Roseospira goensis TaxID=391922 RepID=A0A7W6RX33_9PROT|nr:addiction module toxin RelE [Roseospira goensis]MBB4284681.1 hypothetical protein [Roseospira goensis]